MKCDEPKGCGRLLSVWEAPPDAGEPVGCIATTFTFQATFFEEQCLARFLGLETDAREQGSVAYLIERAERLRQARVFVLADRRHAGSVRLALDWDLLAVSVPGAALHSKISVLVWSDCVRLIIGSANLTEVAYRENLEVFGVLDFKRHGEAPVAELRRTLDFLDDILALASEGPARERAASFIGRVRAQVGRWREHRPRGDQTSVTVVFGGRCGQKRLSVLQTLRHKIWRDSAAPTRAWVVSPFFDAKGDATAKELASSLSPRGSNDVTFDVFIESEPKQPPRIHAPKSLCRVFPEAAFRSVLLCNNDHQRQLHAKCLWMENQRWALYMIGSSNFTQAGLGVGKNAWNVEANLAYSAPARGDACDMLAEAYPPFNESPVNHAKAIWDPQSDDAADTTDSQPALPTAFVEATFTPAERGGTLRLTFEHNLPHLWAIYRPEDRKRSESLVDSSTRSLFRLQLTQRNKETHSKNNNTLSQTLPARAHVLELEWKDSSPPSALLVCWRNKHGNERKAFWPVNVSDPAKLPPPEALRNLALETLLDIYASTRPLYDAVLNAHERVQQRVELPPPELNEHTQVEPLTRTFLLQRTRRVARALEELWRRLERPVPNHEALEWRLHGPVGPMALARAIQTENRDTREPGEVAFLMAEIALTLHRVRPEHVPGMLSRATVRAALRKLIRELRTSAMPALEQARPDLRKYIGRAFREAMR